MARLTFKRLLLVGVAVAAGAAYAKRDTVRQLLPGGGSTPEPEPYSPPPPPQPSNYDAPGPPANTATPVPAPDPVVTPEPGRSDPVEEAPIQADDEAAVADAIADAEAAAEAAAGESVSPGAPAHGVSEPAPGDPPTQLVPDASAASDVPLSAAPETSVAGPDEPTEALPSVESAVTPEPIDEEAEASAAAAEAAAIGGSAGNEYAGNELGETATEAERPLAEAGEGVAEGQEQAEAELEENAQSGEGMSDAERQIDETIEAADNPALGETPERVTTTEEQPPAAKDDSDDDDISGGDWKTWSGGAVKPQ
jgi:hypothetical protein